VARHQKHAHQRQTQADTGGQWWPEFSRLSVIHVGFLSLFFEAKKVEKRGARSLGSTPRNWL
jgi:hypothetical protein